MNKVEDFNVVEKEIENIKLTRFDVRKHSNFSTTIKKIPFSISLLA